MDRFIHKIYRPFLLPMALYFVSGLGVCVAQDLITELDEIEIIASPIEKYGVGATINKIDSSLLKNYSHSNLAAVLMAQSSIYIKQYGSGMLSTVSFRGTGAGHTVVRWEGLQVGYPFLGQTDLSLLPTDFTNEIRLVHGSSSARFGTGAIGGIINLESASPGLGLGVKVNQSIGSFGTSNTSLRISNAGDKGYVKLAGVYNKSKNNFQYQSSSGTPLGEQKNADFNIYGFKAEAGYKLNSKNLVEVTLQGINADRNLQPSIGSTASNNQLDNNFWSSLKYNHNLYSGVVTAQYGYLFDRINYNGSVTDSKQHNFKAELEYDLNNALSFETGLNSNWVGVVTPNYENNNAKELRSNIYGSLLWKATNRLNTTLNLRQAFVSGYKIPFTPSVGVDYQAIKSELWQLNLIGQVAKGYKVPTLNDRFWVPGGNEELSPEESINLEIGFNLKNNNGFPFWINATTYQLWVDNWILWLPNGAIWSPVNKRKVNGVGIELETGFEKKVNQAQLRGWLNYAYTKSTNQEALDEYDRSAGKQLPYVPFHNGNITGQLDLKNWEFQLNGLVTGKRFITTDNETEVPGYTLLNTQIAYNLYLEQWSLRVFIEANNITNTNYQSIINKAMPGINFLAGVQIHFNN
jgi:outer membrane cobalamin receptor